jgi:predicted Zn finger-like uncharacterized protein
MILTCPACSTQFAVPQGAIPPHGRSVRCSRCGHSWHQQAAPSTQVIAELESFVRQVDADQLDDAAEEERLFADRRQRMLQYQAVQPAHAAMPSGSRLKSFFVFCLIIVLLLYGLLVGLVFYRSYLPQLEPLFARIGFADVAAFTFDKVQFQSEPRNGKLTLRITAQVTNRSPVSVKAPKITIRLYNAEQVLLGELAYPTPDTPIRPGEFLKLEPEIANVNKSARLVVMDIGDGVERYLRPIEQ